MNLNFTFFFIFLIFTSCKPTNENKTQKETIIDERDSQEYPIIKIGNDWWMATNLNFKSDESYCLENEEVNGNKYGRLYTWKSSLTACPKGWHLPSKKEWEKMLNEIQNENESPNTDYYQVIKKRYAKLIKGGESKFHILIAGNRKPNGEFYKMNGFYWTSSEKEGTLEEEKSLYSAFGDKYGGKLADYGMSIWFRPGDKAVYSNNAAFVKKNAFSCRCLKDK